MADTDAPAPTINVKGPDGSNFAFPAGTPDNTISRALQQHYGDSGAGAGGTAQSDVRRGGFQNFFAGANEDIAKMLGAPVDFAAKILNGQGAGWDDLTPEQRADFAGRHPTAAAIMDKWSNAAAHPIGGSETIENAMGALPAGGADPRDVAAKTSGEKIARAAGEGASAMVVPGLGAEAALARSTAEADSFGNTLLGIIKGNGVVSNAITGAASGAGAEAAAEKAPEPYKPLAALAGGIAGGVGAAGITAAGHAVGGAAKSALDAITEAPELRAAREIAERAQDPAALRDALISANEEDQLVPGSSPTTFQASGDLGVGSLEREVAASPTGVAPFAARREAQNSARLAAVDKLAEAEADPNAVGDFVKSRLQELTQQHASNVAGAAHGVADALAGAGGESFDNPAAYGEALRTPLAALHQQAKDNADKLWRAIDPSMTSPVATAPLKQATDDLVASIQKSAKPPEGDEANILSVIQNYDPSEPFGELVALRSRLADAARQERRAGTPTVLRRLTIVQKAVDTTLANKASEIAQSDQQAVAAGEMAPEDTMLARMRANLEQDRAQHYAQSNVGAAALGRANGGSGAQGFGTNAGAGPSAVPGADGAEVQGLGGLGNAAGDSSLSPVGGVSDEVNARYAEARAATAALKNTYEKGPVGGALAPGAQYGSFKTTASNVARNLFDRPEAFQAFVEAAKDDPAALAPMKDYAAFSLRQAAVKDGMLSPAKYRAWVADHGYVFEQFPDLATKFADIATAQNTLDESLVAQKAALTDYQNSAAKYFLKDQSPEQAVANAIKSPQAFGELVNSMKDDPAALAGLKRATVDYIKKQGLSTAEAGTSGELLINPASLQKTLLNNRGALSRLFNAEEIQSMDNIVADLRQSGRSINAVRIPGGSNTAQDTASRATSMIRKLIQDYGGKGIGATVGSVLGGPAGTAAGLVVGAAGDSVRAARAKSIDSALTEMMLDPKMAAAWLAKIPGPAESTGQVFSRQVRSVLANQVMRAVAQENQR